jgi:hypothetical protein
MDLLSRRIATDEDVQAALDAAEQWPGTLAARHLIEGTIANDRRHIRTRQPGPAGAVNRGRQPRPAGRPTRQPASLQAPLPLAGPGRPGLGWLSR